jgi:hypothetical protein
MDHVAVGGGTARSIVFGLARCQPVIGHEHDRRVEMP